MEKLFISLWSVWERADSKPTQQGSPVQIQVIVRVSCRPTCPGSALTLPTEKDSGGELVAKLLSGM